VERIEEVEQILPLSFDEASFSIVHVDGQEGEAGFPLIVEPAAAAHSLGNLLIPEPVHDEKKYISPPAIVRIQNSRNIKQSQNTHQLFPLAVPEVFDTAEGQISQEQRKIYILPFAADIISVHIIPGYLRKQGKKQQIPAVLEPAAGVGKALDQQKTVYRKCNPPNVPEDPVKTGPIGKQRL
jgi:hypothetical protein